MTQQTQTQEDTPNESTLVRTADISHLLSNIEAVSIAYKHFSDSYRSFGECHLLERMNPIVDMVMSRTNTAMSSLVYTAVSLHTHKTAYTASPSTISAESISMAVKVLSCDVVGILTDMRSYLTYLRKWQMGKNALQQFGFTSTETTPKLFTDMVQAVAALLSLVTLKRSSCARLHRKITR